MVSATTGPNPELADMTRRFWIALALTLPVIAIELGEHVTAGWLLTDHRTAPGAAVTRLSS